MNRLGLRPLRFPHDGGEDVEERPVPSERRSHPRSHQLDDLSALPAASGTGTIAARDPYSFASGVLLKSNMPATIAETVFITNDNEGQLLSNGTGARQQQIAEALRKGIEGYLSTH